MRRASSLEMREGPGAAQSRGRFAEVFDETTAAWRGKHGELPALMCGMVGSAFGWVEAPYLPCPEDLDELADSALRIRDGVHVIPGMRCTNPLGAPDVMRGEETQLLGALAPGKPGRRRPSARLHAGHAHQVGVGVAAAWCRNSSRRPPVKSSRLLCDHSVLVRDKATPITHVAPDFERGLAEAARHPGCTGAPDLPGAQPAARQAAVGGRRGLLDLGPADRRGCRRRADDVRRRKERAGAGHRRATAHRVLFGWRWRAAAARPCRSTARRPRSPGWRISSRSGSAHDGQERGNGRHPARAHATTRARGWCRAGRRRLPLHRGAAQFPGTFPHHRGARRTRTATAWSAPAPCSRAAEVDRVHGAGGRLVVAPNCDPAVIRRALELGMRVLPGIATATEAFTALDAGATELKLFPASTYGPRHLKALKSVLPKHVRVFPVGGIGSQDIAEWLVSGADGFGFGSELFTPAYTLAELTKRAHATLRGAARGHWITTRRRTTPQREGVSRESGNCRHRHPVCLRGRHLRARAVGVAREGHTPEGRAGLFPRVARAALVGHRHLADRREHLRRADRRHVRLRLRDGHGHRLVRVDGGADAHHRRQVDPAGVPQERHLHHAGVPREALQPRGAHRDGHLLAGAVHLRESHLDPVARLARGERDHRPRPAGRHHRARRCSRCCTRCTAASRPWRSPTSCRCRCWSRAASSSPGSRSTRSAAMPA